jgi:hypothetical protein
MSVRSCRGADDVLGQRGRDTNGLSRGGEGSTSDAGESERRERTAVDKGYGWNFS